MLAMEGKEKSSRHDIKQILPSFALNHANTQQLCFSVHREQKLRFIHASPLACPDELSSDLELHGKVEI
jgi:hypothetical protein